MPLMLGISLDLFLVGRLILNNLALSAVIAIAMFLVFFGFWYVFPWTAGILHSAEKENLGRDEKN